MRTKIIFLLMILFLSVYSCKKGKADFTVKGVVMDETIGGPLSGANVSLYEIEPGGSGINLLGNLTTTSDGVYSFTFPRNTVESYSLIIDKPLYFKIDEVINFSDLTIESDNIINYSTTAKAWVNLRFINDSPLPSDVLSYTKSQGKSGCEECCDSGTKYLNGAIDTSIICINDGNTTYAYQYSVVGTSDQGSKSAVTTPFDTTIIQLNY